jgi:hypothetical protein
LQARGHRFESDILHSDRRNFSEGGLSAYANASADEKFFDMLNRKKIQNVWYILTFF